MRRHIIHVLVLFAVLLASVSAFAQTASSVTPTTGLSTGALAWIGLGNSILLALAPWVNPANTDTPGNWSGPTRVFAATAISVVLGILKQITSAPETPWYESVVVVLATLGPSLFAHFSTTWTKTAKLRMSMLRGTSGGHTVNSVMIGLAAVGTIFVMAIACTPVQTAADEKLAQCILAANQSAPTGLSDIQQIEYDAQQCSSDIITVVNTLEAKAKADRASKSDGGAK
jgi:hypothetical protein